MQQEGKLEFVWFGSFVVLFWFFTYLLAQNRMSLIFGICLRKPDPKTRVTEDAKARQALLQSC